MTQKVDDEDDDDEIEDTPVKNSFQAKFALLASDDDVDAGDNDNDDDDNDEGASAPTKSAPVSAASKKKAAKKKAPTGKGKKNEENEIDALLAAIESTSVSNKKSAGSKKAKAAMTTASNLDQDDFKEGEGQDLEDILKVSIGERLWMRDRCAHSKEIDEQFDEKDRRKQAKKDKRKKKKDEPTGRTEFAYFRTISTSFLFRNSPSIRDQADCKLLTMSIVLNDTKFDLYPQVEVVEQPVKPAEVETASVTPKPEVAEGKIRYDFPVSRQSSLSRRSCWCDRHRWQEEFIEEQKESHCRKEGQRRYWC